MDNHLCRRAALTLLAAVLTAMTAWAQGLSGSGTIADPQMPILNPSDEFVASLGFINEKPTCDNGEVTNWYSGQNYNNLVDGNINNNYGLSSANPWVEFHYASPITPKGYALWTAQDTYTYPARNPKSWTIKAKNNGDADWTTLVTVDNSSGVKLPVTNVTRTVFALDNSTAYQYFRFEAVKDDTYGFQLAELQFCTVQPTIPVFVISSSDDWNTFAQNVTNGTDTYKDKLVRLAADITVSTMVGDNSHPFKGIFDGCGHTLSVGYNVTEDYAAPFRYVDGATIKNLHVSGTIITSQKFAGGLMARPSGNCTISNCLSSVAITGSKSGDGTHGGIVGIQDDYVSLTITDCAFNGKLLTTNGTSHSGGIVGWRGNTASLTIKNCLYAPAAATGSETWISNTGSATFSRYDTEKQAPTITNCYYTQTLGPAQGTDASGMTAADLATALNNGGGNWQVIGGNVVPVMVQCPEGLSVDSDDGSFYVNMPKTGTKTVTLPDGFTSSFKVYDDGGKGGGGYSYGDAVGSGNHSNNCRSTLVLTAPTGCVLQLSGSITTERGDDYLTVYDNSAASGTELLYKVKSSPNHGTPTAITANSTGNAMTLYFYSDYARNYDGLDLTVTVFELNVAHNINGLGSVTGGSVAASVGGTSVTKAKLNDVVTLTATPASGYVLSDLSVTYASGNAVADWTPWTNTATFTMPGTAVTVTPTFTAINGLSVNMPKKGTKTVTIPSVVQSFKVYDDGGASGNYSDNCSGTLTLTAPAGYVLRLSGNIVTEKKYDKLTVYDNSAASGTKLLNEVSSTSNGTQTAITATSTGNAMTLYFTSDISENYAGLDLTVTIIDPNAPHNINGLGNVTGGSIAASVGGTSANTAKLDDVVTLTATPASGYVLSGISVTNALSNAVAVDWNEWTNTATFTMPGTAVTVTPTFTAVSGLYINMPKTGTKTVSIPSVVQTFKVYDDGGATGNYSDHCDGTLVLTAPTGYVLRLSGNITSQTGWDKLTVYDNNAASGTKLIDAVSSDPWAKQTDIQTVTSTGNAMTLYFYSAGYANYAGLDLTVTLVDATVAHNINGLGSVTGGSIAATVGGTSASTAKLNDVVTLTATPASGYVLGDLSVVDASSNAVAVDWNVWTNTATFTMPNTAVTVTPTFTAASTLSINMPKTGKKTAIIPTGVQSFKVYDDGGASGNYSDNCSGTLTLTAPAGYVLRLSGNITTENNMDWLTIYDGSDNNAATLGSNLSSTSDGTPTAITATSTGTSMTLYFYSGTSNNYAGLDLTVTAIPAAALTLYNGTSNDATLTANNGQVCPVVLADRTIYRDGTWNTLVLPFSLATLNGTPLEGFTVKTLQSSTFVNGELTLNFANANSIEAGKPYIVKWDQTPISNLVNPVFENVLISNATANVSTTYADFIGSYAPITGDGLLLDSHNPNGDAMHAAIRAKLEGYSVSCYTQPDINYPATAIPFSADGNVTLWTICIRIDYNLNGGTNHADNPATYNIESASITLQAPDKTGYTFSGWFDNEDCTGDAVTTIAHGSHDNVTLYAKWTKNALILSDVTDNSEAISAAAASDKIFEVTLANRTIDTDWNTLAVPFDVSAAQLEETFGAGVKLYTLEESTFGDGVLGLEFASATSIKAGVPYFIKAATEVFEPTFRGVTIVASDNKPSETSYVDFIPTLGATAIGEEGDDIYSKLFLGASNTLYNPPYLPVMLKGFRGYFHVHNLGGSANAAQFRMNFEEEGEISGIIDVQIENSKLRNENDAVYNLMGQKVKNATAREIHVVKGKRVMVK